MKKSVHLYVLFLALFINSAYPLSHKNLEKEVENYLNSIKSLSAEFVQESGDVVSRGFLNIKKPGKARIDYKSPDDFLLILKNKRLIYYNFDLEEYANLPHNSNFLNLLASTNFAFSNFSTYKVKRSGKQLIADVEIREDELAEGRIYFKLIFDILANEKLSINSIIINDFVSAITNFKLVDTRYDVDISEKKFRFNNPNFFKK